MFTKYSDFKLVKLFLRYIWHLKQNAISLVDIDRQTIPYTTFNITLKIIINISTFLLLQEYFIKNYLFLLFQCVYVAYACAYACTIISYKQLLSDSVKAWLIISENLTSRKLVKFSSKAETLYKLLCCAIKSRVLFQSQGRLTSRLEVVLSFQSPMI